MGVMGGPGGSTSDSGQGELTWTLVPAERWGKYLAVKTPNQNRTLRFCCLNRRVFDKRFAVQKLSY